MRKALGLTLCPIDTSPGDTLLWFQNFRDRRIRRDSISRLLMQKVRCQPEIHAICLKTNTNQTMHSAKGPILVVQIQQAKWPRRLPRHDSSTLKIVVSLENPHGLWVAQEIGKLASGEGKVGFWGGNNVQCIPDVMEVDWVTYQQNSVCVYHHIWVVNTTSEARHHPFKHEGQG